MQRTLDVVFQQHREFAAVGDGARFLRQVLQDDARVIRAAEKRSIDTLGASLDHWSRRPHEHDSKHGAQGHADIGSFRKES